LINFRRSDQFISNQAIFLTGF